MTTIHAYAALEAGGTLEPFTYEVGALGEHDVEIDVRYCGICHSDLSMIDNEWGFSQYPLVAGHEITGTIAAIGSHVKHLHVGQWVGLGWHADYCHTCQECTSGDHNLCSTAQPTIIGRNGGFADKVRANASSVVALPDGIEPASAGPLFCGGITVFNPMIQFDIKPTDRVAVIGIGGLGHMAVQFLRAWGCHVTAFTSSESKTQEALELGADATINSRDAAALAAAAGQFDYIISTVNVKLDWNGYMATLKPKGRLHFVGATTEPLDLSVFPMLMGQRSVSASPVGSPATIAKMLEFAKHHDIKPKVEMFDFSDINSAINRVRSGQARYRVVLKR